MDLEMYLNIDVNACYAIAGVLVAMILASAIRGRA